MKYIYIIDDSYKFTAILMQGIRTTILQITSFVSTFIYALTT